MLGSEEIKRNFSVDMFLTGWSLVCQNHEYKWELWHRLLDAESARLGEKIICCTLSPDTRIAGGVEDLYVF